MCFVKPKPFLYQVEKDKTFYPFSKGQQVNTPCPLVLKLMTLETFLKENDGLRYIIHWVRRIQRVNWEVMKKRGRGQDVVDDN